MRSLPGALVLVALTGAPVAGQTAGSDTGARFPTAPVPAPAFGATAASPQVVAPPPFDLAGAVRLAAQDPLWDDPPQVSNLVAYGIVGALAGGAAMAAVTDCLGSPLSERCWPINLGQAIGVATGVHMGNERRGVYALDLLASGVVAAGGLLALRSDDGIGVTSQPTTIFLLPVGQLLVSVLAERLSSH